MMVYGHQSSASEGAFFMQNYLRHYPSETESAPQMAPAAQPPPLMHHHQKRHQLTVPPPLLPPLPPHHHSQSQHLQHQPPQPLLPPPPKLKFQGVCGNISGFRIGDMAGNTMISECCQEIDDFPVGEGGDINDAACCDFQQGNIADCGTNSGGETGSNSGFLYSLLTAQDAAAVQQCSAFLGGTADQFPRRSQSVSVPARRGSAALTTTCQEGPLAATLGHQLFKQGGGSTVVRPSSAPRGLRGPHGGGSAPALTTEEPLDLSGVNFRPLDPAAAAAAAACDGASVLEQQMLLQHLEHQKQLQQMQQQQSQHRQQQHHRQQQPMLRNMLSAVVPYSMPTQLSPRQQHQQLQHQQLQQQQLQQQQFQHQQLQQQQLQQQQLQQQQLQQQQLQHQQLQHQQLQHQQLQQQQLQQQQLQQQHHHQLQEQQSQYQRIHQPIQLAKKTVPVAQSHVADWLKKGTELVRTNSALFSALEPAHRSSLLCRAWPRILQLYMLEHNFQFAVSPAQAASNSEVAAMGGRRATLGFAEDLQRLIGSAAVLPFDTVTYNLLRLAAIFVADATDQPHLAEVHSEIMKHIYSHLRIKSMSQLYNDAVALLHAVAQTNKAMLESLFCTSLMSQTVDEFIRSQLA